jgi:enoyl-CoA hydratase
VPDAPFYHVDKRPPVAWVYLDRPAKHNAMHPPAWREAPAVFADLDADPNIRAVVLSGRGACFSAGIDLMAMAAELPELGEADQRGGVKWRLLPKIRALQDAMTSIENCRKPVIAAIHGHCVGAGLDMAAACDIRLCSRDASFCLKEAAVGFVADVGVLQRLPLIVGQGITRELAFAARPIDAVRAQAILLVNAVFPDHAALMAGAGELAAAIAANAPVAVQATKNVLNYGVGRTVAEGLEYVAAVSTAIIPSQDLMEALTAFMEKRPPRFTGA